MEIKVATHIGQVREKNEDSYWVGNDCLVVCDGMGGHQGGEVASRLAVKTISTYPFAGDNPRQEVRAAIEQAHRRLKRTAAGNRKLYGMGTTVTVAYLTHSEQGPELTVGHVGDSRAYLFFNQELVQLTSDHSVVGELVRGGSLSAQEAKNHAQRHVLTQALGAGEIEIELISRSLKPKTWLLLCTDGLTDVVDDQQIKQVLSKTHNSSNAAQELVDLANSLGGPDNVTVIVAQVA